MRSLLLASALTALCSACPTTPPPPSDATPDALDAPDAAPLDAAPPDDGPPPPPVLTVFTPSALTRALAAYAALTAQTPIAVTEASDPVAEVTAEHGVGIRVAALADLTCPADCFRVELASAHNGAVVHGNGPLGVQYGLTHLFERMGYRFFHPLRARVPAALALPSADPAAFDVTFTAEQTLRGIQLHTLHPIESLVFWTPGDDNAARARAIIDWIVRNRGNYLQVVGLANIVGSDTIAASWRAHTRALIDYAHQRGLRVGIGVQLFGTSNLQRAYDLLDHPDDPDPVARIRERLTLITTGLPWDLVDLSFGEFSGVSPDLFVARVNDTRNVLAEVLPTAEMAATIHVGNAPSLRVTYMGTTQLYYFLVRYADPRIVPWVHTVMYYTLFDDAGGAYLHDDFGEHRAYLLGRLSAGQRVAYFPESAYWVAFDNSVPTYLPLYVRSRWRDMHEIRAAVAATPGSSPLREHVEFSSGFEWGYWQNDAATLRMGFSLPDRWEQSIEEMYAPWGAAGAQVAAQIARLGELHYAALIQHRLAAYLAGRDVAIDTGETMGIVSQPLRPSLASVATMDATARARFVDSVVAPLEQLADDTDAVLHAIETSGADLSDHWIAEVRDGVAVDALRTRFIATVFRGAVTFGASGNDGGALARLAPLLDSARAVVMRRHADLHWPNARELTARRSNPTLYPHGYLYYADQLCYWQRELVELRAVVNRTSEVPPGCFL